MSFSPLSVPAPHGILRPNEIRLRLQQLLPALADFGSREEAQFVEIGQRLGDFLQRSRIISRHSDEVIDALLRKEVDEVLAALHSLMDDLECHIARLFDDARQHQESLRQVAIHIQGIEAPLQSLAKVIKILHSLSFSTKVESTQGHSVVVLQALADDLKGLATKIHGKTDAVRDRLKFMLSLAGGALEKTQIMAEVSLRQAGNHLQQCRSLLDTVASRRSTGLVDARRLQDYSATIAAALNEIISSVQFHDITHQQVEHVQHALQDFCGRLAGESIVENFAVETANFCAVQSAQLRHTRHDLVSAVVRMMSSLRSIAPAVQQLAQKTRNLSTSTESAGASLLNDVESVLTTVTRIIATADQEDQQAVAAVSEVLDVLNELSHLLQEVESIGTEMKMISLNAGITAAHNLERGAGLGVIARSIQNLSSEVLTRTDELATVYRQMECLAQELNSNGSVSAAPDVAGTTQLNATAASFLARLQLMNQCGVEVMTKLDQEALALAGDVVKTADKITIHVEAGKIIDHLVADLESLGASFNIKDALVGETKVLDLISQNYTMQSERRVHNEVRQTGGAVAEPMGQDLTGLGENVELF